jgi:hypothetical protein
MPAPLVGLALGAAARIAAKKAATKAAKASARGLKAAKKPTNRTGTKADRTQRAELQGNSNLIKNASPARANRTRGGSLYAQKTYGGQGLVSKTLTPKQAARQAEITKELNPVRSVRKKDAVPVKTTKANARGLKAANKPTNKVGSKADKEIRSRTKSVSMSKEETKANYDYYYGKGSGENITQINKRVTPKNDARSVRKFTPTPKKKSAVQLRPKKK